MIGGSSEKCLFLYTMLQYVTFLAFVYKRTRKTPCIHITFVTDAFSFIYLQWIFNHFLDIHAIEKSGSLILTLLVFFFT